MYSQTLLHFGENSSVTNAGEDSSIDHQRSHLPEYYHWTTLPKSPHTWIDYCSSVPYYYLSPVCAVTLCKVFFALATFLSVIMSYVVLPVFDFALDYLCMNLDYFPGLFLPWSSACYDYIYCPASDIVVCPSLAHANLIYTCNRMYTFTNLTLRMQIF